MQRRRKAVTLQSSTCEDTTQTKSEYCIRAEILWINDSVSVLLYRCCLAINNR